MTARPPLVYNQATGGFMALPAGDTLIGSLRLALSQFGPVDTPSDAQATFAAAFAALGRAGTILIDETAAVGTGPVANPGVEMDGSYPVEYSPTYTGSLGVPPGRCVQNLPGRDWSLRQWGEEYLIPMFLNKIVLGESVSIACIGDSNMEGHMGPILVAMLQTIPGATVVNYGASGTTLDQWRTATGGFAPSQPYAGKDMLSVLATNPDLLVQCYGGTNDPSFNGGTSATFLASLQTTLAYIRGTTNGTKQLLGIVNCTSAMQGSGYDGYAGQVELVDEAFNAEVRPGIIQACLDYSCAFFDKNGWFPDALVDFIAGANQDTVLDTNRVHTQPPLSQMLAQLLFDFIYPPAFAGAGDFAIPMRNATDALTLYPAGLSISRTGTGWAADGFVFTIKALDTGSPFPLQINWRYAEPEAYIRLWNQTAWSPFFTLGIADLTSHGYHATEPMTSYPTGQSQMRAPPGSGFPLDGDVIITKFADGYGTQVNSAYSSDVAVQTRTWISTGGGQWGTWR